MTDRKPTAEIDRLIALADEGYWCDADTQNAGIQREGESNLEYSYRVGLAKPLADEIRALRAELDSTRAVLAALRDEVTP